MLACLAPAIARAQEPAVPRVASADPADKQERPLETLDDLLQAVVAGSPELAAARLMVAASAELPPLAGSLPDPVLGTTLRNVDFPELTLGEEMMTTAGVSFSQTLPLGGKRPAARAVAERAIAVDAARAERTRRRLIREVSEAWFALAFIYDAIRIVDETMDFVRELEATSEARYAVGQGIQQDVLKAQVELSVLRDRQIQLAQQRDSIVARINRVLGRPAAAELPVPPALRLPEPELDPSALGAEALAASAMLRERDAKIRRQEAQVAVADADRSPDLMLKGAWMSRGGLPSIWEVGIGISLPIRKENRQDRAVAAAMHELEARHEERRDAAADVDAAVRDSQLELDRARRLVQLYREAIVPQATLALDSAIAAYTVARVDFLSVIDNVVTLLTYRLEAERQAAAALQATVRIEEHLGRSLGATPPAIWTERAAEQGPAEPGQGEGR